MRRILVITTLWCLPLFGQSAKNLVFYPSAVGGAGANGTAPDTSQALQIIDWKNYYLGGLLLGQSFADSLTFLVSNDGTTYYKLNVPASDSSKALVVEVDSSAAAAVTLPEQAFKPWDFIKVITDVGVGNDSTQTATLTRRGSLSR